ncbi:lipopolysaccharide/colanic/teichoic acid biosynthesis glycosyltransferase [Anoxybacillus tengchongensis]|uniref:Lipopolysaccharide/colanic/teichoic acid biosynthesis glycosyltransferase n=1 Tax=Anoxybacillus tengchongensis TaxID=576944 RepID=A0A7X0D900_9BACL|nr:sugar transferase [Anoxybacillus tengchongensis]MBB6176103.1 lipopolysaccharide/colanic/teichoic acid biosynthesis glycosyltransferase [Anoxybacillus tengchongensis]
MAKLNTAQEAVISSQRLDYVQFRSLEDTSRAYAITKRVIDILGAIIGLILSSPLFLCIGIFYLFGDSKGPILFKQTRVGKHGERFYIYKFRSMTVNAEEKLKADKELYQKYLRNNYKLEPHEDPRITNLGRFLRKTSLDEIPQLINVLKGEMSLVGPRPVVEEELKEYGREVSKFLSVKPGMTGYWQVSGRSEVGYPERVNVELFYVEHQSLILDIVILVKTVFMVVLRRGAY